MKIKLIILLTVLVSLSANSFDVKSYGHYKQMIHKKNTTGVIDLSSVVSEKNTYAVGAIADGVGEITVIDGKIYLDYGKDGLGNSLNKIPEKTKAVLLVTTKVKEWQNIKIKNNLSKMELFKEILKQAKLNNFNTKHPFPFLLQGEFESLKIHAISSQNPNFTGHGMGQKLFHMSKDELIDENAVIVGFYSADSQGVYTHPNESWHLHSIIDDIAGHVDGLYTGSNIVLKLPIK
jgi:alpha-acetolactate decarboxylase